MHGQEASVGGVLAGVLAAIVSLAMIGAWAWAVVRVLNKAGRSGWWVLPMFVPLVNLAMIWVFAHAHWPQVGPPRPPSGAAPAGPARPASERLAELEPLYREGRITPEEYAERRRAILDSL